MLMITCAKRTVWAVAAVWLLVPGTASAQGERVTIWDGVYTTAQAERGETTYVETCSRCHNLELQGSDRGPALSGDEFWSNWENSNLDQLFALIRDTMPQGGQANVDEGRKLEALAYILQQSAFPPGTDDLTTVSAELASIMITPKGIWNGVFTEEQAARGKAGFESTCARCHGPDLAGGDRGPALVGESFMLNWENATIGNVFTKILDTMPADGVVVAPEDKIDILAYIFQSNTFPAGDEELTNAGDVLEVQILREGAEPIVPNFALVQMVGCLDSGPDQAWLLTDTSEPVAAREAAIAPLDLQRAESQPLGQDTYRLVSATPFDPTPRRGHKVTAKGLLYRESDGNRLNLTGLETVAESCR